MQVPHDARARATVAVGAAGAGVGVVVERPHLVDAPRS
jgi:hypothetical protein